MLVFLTTPLYLVVLRTHFAEVRLDVGQLKQHVGYLRISSWIWSLGIWVAIFLAWLGHLLLNFLQLRNPRPRRSLHRKLDIWNRSWLLLGHVIERVRGEIGWLLLGGTLPRFVDSHRLRLAAASTPLWSCHIARWCLWLLCTHWLLVYLESHVLLVNLAYWLLYLRLWTLCASEWGSCRFNFSWVYKLLLRRLINRVKFSEVCFDALSSFAHGRFTTHTIKSNIKHRRGSGPAVLT